MTTPEDKLVADAQAIARTQNRDWTHSFEHVLRFCIQNPSFFPKKTGFDPEAEWSPASSLPEKYLANYIMDFYREREGTITLREAATRPDPAVDTVLAAFAKADADTIARMSLHHRQSMAAENLIGKLLERYVASIIEPTGWVWCCGETVRSVDFLRQNGSNYQLLQIKNRTNSENSSSTKVRTNRTVAISVWKRINATTGRTYWETFPGNNVAGNGPILSEAGFHAFIAASANTIRVKSEESSTPSS